VKWKAEVELEADPERMFHRIAIVGCGLIGGSLALALRAAWPSSQVLAIDAAPIAERARILGVATDGRAELSLAEGADLIVLAAPVRQNIAILGDLVRQVPGAAIVTDVGSTKRAMVDAARELPDRLRFVGGHPLAGAATGGLDAARADLFRGRPWILTGDADRPEVERVAEMVRAVGAHPAVMDPIAHDRMMAYVSHLPQLAVSALMHVVGERAGAEGLRLAGNGLRDTTRLASSPAGTWRDVTATNVDALGAAIDDLIDALRRLKQDLAAGDDLQEVFAAAAAWKKQLDESERPRDP
jgi:prephenate dehydrogenase